jgi:hypothetical protein
MAHPEALGEWFMEHHDKSVTLKIAKELLVYTPSVFSLNYYQKPNFST